MKSCIVNLCCAASVLALVGTAGADGQAAKSVSAVSAPVEKVKTTWDVGSELEGRLNGRSDRQLPDAGAGPAGCQLLYGTNHNNATSFECLDDFRPVNSGNITTVSWAGVWRKGTTGATFANAQPPGLEPLTSGPEQFEITFYRQDPAGGAFDPGVPLGAATDIFPLRVSRQLVVSPTRTVDPQTVTVGTVTFTIYNYIATLPAPVAVTNAECYYIQIRAVCNSNFDGSFNNPASTVPGWSFRWMRAAAGNGRALQVASTNNVPPTAVCPTPTTAAQTVSGTVDATAADFAFCLNLPIDRAAPCKSTGTCQQGNANCQNYANGTENRFSFAAGAKSADNFRVNANVNLTSMCWTGFYAGQAAVPTDQSFTITIYNNNTTPAGSLGTFSFPGTVVATRTVTPATTGNDGQTRVNPARFNGPPVTYTNFFEWNAVFNTPIALTPGCYWVEIVSNSATGWVWLSNWGDPNSQVRNGGDNYVAQRPLAATGWDASSRVEGFDFAFCLSFGINPIGNACPAGPAAANVACTAAVPLTVGSAAVPGFVFNVGGGVDSNGNQLPPAFGTVIDNAGGGGVWYTVQGNGQNLTVSTCNTGTSPGGGVPAQTNYDTFLAVYCASSCAGPFKAVASNDDATAAACSLNPAGTSVGASTVTFPSVSGQTYYVYVYRQAFSGFHYINATSAALTTLTPVPCADIAEPPAPIATFPAGAVVETEACGANSAATVPGETCQTPYSALIGTRYCGTIDSNPEGFDNDVYRFPDITNATNFFTVELNNESPLNIFIFAGGPATCPATGDPDGATTQVAGFTIFPNNRTGVIQFELANLPVGQLFVYIQPTQTDGMSCATNRNRYCLFIGVPALGACCIQSGTGCTVTSIADCANEAGSNGQWTGGGVCDSSFCDPNTGLAVAPVGACCAFDGGCFIATSAGCTTNNGDPTGNTWQGAATVCTTTNICPAVQACCFSNGSCTLYISSFCTASGGTSVSGRVCLPNSCQQAPATGRCCIGARCAITLPTACNPAGTAGRVFTAGASNCNTAGVLNTPCCFADYNKAGGVTVQDIFDFLTDYFSGSVNANVGGDGTALPTVQDIFDYLTGYFAGGC